MNIHGIRSIRALGFPGPRKERIFCLDQAFSEDFQLYLNDLYSGNKYGSTILVFNSLQPLDENPLFDNRIGRDRFYGVSRKDFSSKLLSLVDSSLARGFKHKNLVFVSHETYSNLLISYSGRCQKFCNDDINGWVSVDVIRGLRKANSDFPASAAYTLKIIDKKLVVPSDLRPYRVNHSDGFSSNDECNLEDHVLRMARDLISLEGHNWYLDFEIYKKGNDLFYHDAGVQWDNFRNL